MVTHEHVPDRCNCWQISTSTRCFALMTRLPSNSHWRNESSRHGEPRTPLWSSLELGRATSSGDSARVLQLCHECPAWGRFVPTIASNRVCPCLWVKPEFVFGAHLHNFGIHPNDWLLQPIFTLLLFMNQVSPSIRFNPRISHFGFKPNRNIEGFRPVLLVQIPVLNGPLSGWLIFRVYVSCEDGNCLMLEMEPIEDSIYSQSSQNSV